MLTEADYDVLIEAIDYWEQKNAMASSLMGALLIGFVPEDQRDKAKAEEDMHRRSAEAEIRLRKERGIVLKAKLLKMRDSAAAEKAFASAQ